MSSNAPAAKQAGCPSSSIPGTGQTENPSPSGPIPHQREDGKGQGLLRPDPGHDGKNSPKLSLGRGTHARRSPNPVYKPKPPCEKPDVNRYSLHKTP